MLKILSEQAKLNKRTTNTLAKKGIITSDDLVRFVPRKYKNYSKIVTLKEATVGKENAIIVNIRLFFLSLLIYFLDFFNLAPTNAFLSQATSPFFCHNSYYDYLYIASFFVICFFD